MVAHDPIFDSAWLKCGWAMFHAQALQADIARYAHEDPAFRLAEPKYDPKFHCFVLTVKAMTPVPATFGLHLADVVACVHGALDHLAWALVMRGTTPNLPAGKLRSVYFPICDSRGEFNKSIGQKLPGAKRADIAIVRRHQPYIAGQRKLPWHVLVTLRSLSNEGKHRQIQPVWSLPDSAVQRIACHDCELTSGRGRRARRHILDVGAEVSRVYVRKTGPDPKIDVQGKVTTKPALHERLWLEDWLNNTTAFVTSLLFEFSDPPPELFALGVDGLRSV